MPKKSGFTLIELLVTISIIAILSSIGMVLYSSVMKQGRDSRRMSDLRSIQSALEQYYSDQGFYPGETEFRNKLTAAAEFTSSTGNPSPPPTVKTYMNSLPQDPTDPTRATKYKYEAFTSGNNPACDNLSSAYYCVRYCLYAKLENSSLPAPAGCTYTGNYNFAVTPP